MSKGQLAMAIAKLYPESDKSYPGKRATTTEMLLENKSISGAILSQARTMLKWTPQVANQVLAVERPLNDAYQEAQKVKERSEGVAV